MQIDLEHQELSFLRKMVEERIVSSMDADESEGHSSSVFKQTLFEKLKKAEQESSITLPLDLSISVEQTTTDLRLERDGSIHIMPKRRKDD